jgi:hypothetical protein
MIDRIPDAETARLRLLEAYDLETGALGLLRQWQYDQGASERLLETLRAIRFGQPQMLDRRLVGALAEIPPFMMFQNRSPDFPAEIAKPVARLIVDVLAEVSRILGDAGGRARESRTDQGVRRSSTVGLGRRGR